MDRNCLICKKTFSFNLARSKTAKYCSRTCARVGFTAHRGSQHGNWKGGRVRHSEGYIVLNLPNHPNANERGFVFEHRLVMAELIGRALTDTEEVHHKDGDRKNNDPSNLQLVSHLEHIRFENGWKLIDGTWWKPCSGCKKFLTVEANFYKRRKSLKAGVFVTRCKNCVRRISRAGRIKQHA